MENSIKWVKRNSKLMKNPLKTVGFGIPAVKTCPKAGSCAKGCYATMGSYTWKATINARSHNWEITKSDAFATMAVDDLKKMKAFKAVRIHDSGDFYNQDYLDMWCLIAENCPDKTFYAYTKSLHLNFEHVPSNLVIIQSYGGKLDHMIDTSKPHAKVFETLEELESAGYKDGSKTDELAYSGHVKIGLIYHGSKSYKNTAWNVSK